MKKRILLTGGGTAGHVMLHLAMIPRFKEAGYQLDYIGSHEGIERELIEPIADVNYHTIATGKLRRYLTVKNITDQFRVMKGVFQAIGHIHRIKPNLVFSKGGFVSVPVVLAAKLMRVPTLIHESDLTPGLANKLSMPMAKRLLVTFEETLASVNQDKATFIGPVVRPELFLGDKEKARQSLGFSAEKPVILVMGGSLGARAINEALRASLDVITKNYQVIHLCGKGNVEPSLQSSHYQQFDYVSEGLADYLALSDFVITRAGANSIFEFLALNKPMLLIPLPKEVSRGDQILNAKLFEKKGYALTLWQDQLNETTLVKAIHDLENKQNDMIEQMKQVDALKAAEQVMSIVEELAK